MVKKLVCNVYVVLCKTLHKTVTKPVQTKSILINVTTIAWNKT